MKIQPLNKKFKNDDGTEHVIRTKYPGVPVFISQCDGSKLSYKEIYNVIDNFKNIQFDDETEGCIRTDLIRVLGEDYEVNFIELGDIDNLFGYNTGIRDWIIIDIKKIPKLKYYSNKTPIKIIRKKQIKESRLNNIE